MAKNLWLNLRTTADELAGWKEKAKEAGMPLSQYLRRALNRSKVRNREDDKTILLALTRIGINLNQIAHWANTYRGAREALEIIPGLIELEHLVFELAEKRGRDDS